MILKDLYIAYCSNSEFYEKYCSTSKYGLGKMFFFLNTNCRAILTKKGNKYNGFAQSFRVIKEVEGIKRSEWNHKTAAGQEKEKQHTINMRKSELFRVKDDCFELTSRGKVFEKMLDDDRIEEREKRLLCYLLILSGYFDDKKNYIIQRVNYVFEKCKQIGYTEDEVLEHIQSFITNTKKEEFKKNDIFFTEYLYIDSFFDDLNGINFLKSYREAPSKEKKELQEYISWKAKFDCDSKDNKCLLSYKFRNGGNYVVNTLIDDAILLYLSKKIIDSKAINFDQFISVLLDAYADLYFFDSTAVRTFIYDTNLNRSVFQVIFSKVMLVPAPILNMEKDLTVEEIMELGQIDATDELGQMQLENVTSSLKKLAKLNSNYKCVLEKCEACKYFTAKDNHKNYLEIHHFIPREFANDFDQSIEVLENYVALCPSCHRKIHLAEDKERKYMITLLFNERSSSLQRKGLFVDCSTIYHYYGIED